MCGDSEFSVWEGSSANQAALLFTVTLLQVKIIYEQVCREASAALMVRQLFLSTESLLPSALLFSLLKTLLGLNFPLDLLSSFSRSFCKSMERCQENSRFWRVNVILRTLQGEHSEREEHTGSLNEGGMKNKVISRPLFFIAASKTRSSPLSLVR